MPRLSAPSRRDCPPGPSSAARSARGSFPFRHRCFAAVARHNAPVLDASRGAERDGEARPGAPTGRVRRAAAVLVAIAAIAFAAPALAQSLSVGIESDGTGDATAVEGDGLTFTVKMSAAKSGDVSLKWRFVAGTAGSGDYSYDGSQNLTISAGSTSTTFPIDITDDALHENAETFEVEIYDAAGATISRSKAQVTINVDSDNPDAPEFRVGSASVAVDEDAGWATVTVQHWRYLSEVGDITIPYSVVGITATETLDFDATGGTVTFSKGRLETRTIQIPIVDDDVPEGDETFEARFGAPSVGSFSSGRNKRITIRGEEEMALAPTAASGSVTTTADTDYGFAVADFNFFDANGDALSSVTTVTLPGRGTLALGGMNVSAGDTVPGPRIVAGDLTYTPPRGQVGKNMSSFTFRVNDGFLDSTRTYRMTIDVHNKLAGNLGEAAHGTALSLPDTVVDPNTNAYAQQFFTGTSAQELDEVKLAITVPTGTTPKVSIWYGKTKPEREVTGLMLANPTNIHAATDAVKSFKAAKRFSLARNSKEYWIVVERASGSGTISLKRSTTANMDAANADGWTLNLGRWKRSGSASWSRQGTYPLQAELRTVPWRQRLTRVLNMEFSDPGPDEFYTHGEELRITATLSESANIPGTLINLPPHFCGKTNIKGGNGTDRIVFRCTITDGPHTRVHVEADRVNPGGDGDGRRLSHASPPAERKTAVHDLTGPGITDVRVNSPGSDGLWTAGERVEVRYTFSGPMTVTTGSGTPVTWVRRVDTSGDVLGEAVLFDRIDANDANTLVFAKTLSGNNSAAVLALPANSLYPKHGVIAGTDTGALAVLTHRAYRIEPGPSCGALPDEIWCGELKVGGTSGGTTGYDQHRGEIASLAFSYGGSRFAIFGIRHEVGGGGQMIFDAFPRGPSRVTFNQAGFHLHIGNRVHSFPGDVASGDLIGTGQAGWQVADPGWSAGDRVIVRLTGPPASGNQVEVVAPTVEGAPAVGDEGADGQWTEGETVEVTLAFSEAVEVDTANGVPSVGLGLGLDGTQARRAAWLRGSGTAELVFGYTLVQGDGAHTAMAVAPDSLALDGGAIRSVAAGADAALGHNGTLVRARPPRIPEGPSAHFEGVPASHDGSGAFTIELHLSAEPEGLSYRTVAGGLLEATGGTITGARQLTAGSNLAWEVTVAPSGAGDIGLRLPVRPCGKPNAVCIGGRPLAQAAGATVPGVPLTASFSDVPSEHDGTGPFELRFRLSAAPAGLSHRTVRNGLFDVSGGSIGRAWHLQKGNNEGWGLRIVPSGYGDVTLTVRATTDCAGTPGLCTSDGRKLAGGLQATIAGPATLAVADAEVREGPGAVLDFAVTLSRALTETVTVGYNTENGTASAGADYTDKSGTLTFTAGETTKTVSVPVLDDGHDEGTETLTLRLSNPAPVRVKLADAEATGTIDNTNAIPKEWIARFGRTVAEQVIEAVEVRIRAGREPGAEVSLAGKRIGLGPLFGSSPESGGTEDRAAKAAREKEEQARRDALRLADWLKGETDPEEAQRLTSRAVMPRDLLTGSAFALTAETAGKDLVSLWGQGAVTRFDGREGEITLDGEVAIGMLGADWTRGRWTAGVIVSRSSGEGGYSGAPATVDGSGDGAGDGPASGFSTGTDGRVEATLTGLFPWARHALSERLEAWGAAGYGAGELTVTPKKPGTEEDGAATRTDLDLRMAAAGLRGTMLDGGADGLTLTGKTDALVVQTASGRGRSADDKLEPARATVTRLRLGVEANRPVGLGGGAVLTPSLEVGVRHDSGDAETGFGLDLGGGLALSDPKRGLQAELRGRGLLAHQSKGFRDLGFSGSLAWEGKPSSDRGTKLRLTQTLGGSSAGGADALLSRTTLDGLAANDNGAGGNDELKSRRLELKFGYGLAAFGDRFTWTPEAGVGLSDTGRDFSLGWRLVRGGSGGGDGSFELPFEARWRESANGDTSSEHEVGLRLTARF